jgi:uncharacterized protein (DUF2345 family)
MTIGVDDPGPLLGPLPPGTYVTDPDMGMIAETEYDVVSGGVPTGGPNRYTVNVPYDSTTLSMGRGSASWIKDDGFTARTQKHAHVHTLEGANQTMIALGGPTLEGWAGHKGNHLASNDGFMVVTEGNTWLDTNKQIYMVSRTEQVTLRAAAKDLRLQADAAPIQIAANKDVLVGSQTNVTIVADTGAALNDAGYKQVFDKSYDTALTSKGKKELLTILDVAGAIQGICQSFESLDKIGEDGKWGFTSDANGAAKLYVDVIKLISTVGRYFHGKDAPGQVKIAGEQYASMTGGIAASIFGNLSASMTSTLSASVLGGTASLKGLAWASIWAGAGVSVKTLTGKADLKSEKGKVNVSGKQDVAMASSDAKVKVTGKKGVQLNATAGPALVHGSTMAYLGAGTGPGYGVGANDTGVHLGKFNSPKDFAKPGNEVSEGIYVNRSGLGGKFKSGSFQCTDADFRAKAKKIQLEATGNAKVDGQKILLG